MESYCVALQSKERYTENTLYDPQSVHLGGMVTHPKRVMVVDDEAVHRDTLSALLESAGVGVHACARAEDALALLRQDCSYNLILSDVIMPGMDGIEFARRAREICPDAPLVLVTGRDSAMDSVLVEGTVALLKPYSLDTLNALLREYLDVAV